MILFKSIILQAIWFLVVLFGSGLNPAISLLLGASIFITDFLLSRPNMHLLRYFLLCLLFVLFGYISDTTLIFLRIINPESYSYNYLLLWVIFLGYYELVFAKLNRLPFWLLSVLGGLGGSFAYMSASRLGAFQILEGKALNILLVTFIFWSVFFPFSLWVYNMKSFKNYILDKLIFTSFDLSGFKRHKKDFDDYVDFSSFADAIEFENKKALVTGGTSGIGESVLQSLCHLGVCVDFVGRNIKRGEEVQSCNDKSEFVQLDMSDWSAVSNYPRSKTFYDYVVLNAGAMPEDKKVNKENVELQCASQLLGHYILINTLRKNNQISDKSRIVWVSSGGMYLKKLDVHNLINPVKYEKVETYANVKRAQVTLVEELAKSDVWGEFSIHSMHPGWVGTIGLKEALPKFYDLFNSRLRSVEQGADTIVWLLITQKNLENGGFYFDRSLVRPYFFGSYNPSPSQRKLLMSTLDKFI